MIETLLTFKDNLWIWFLENKDSITAWFMSGQALSVLAAIVMLIKNAKELKVNTASTMALDATLVNTNTMVEEVNTLKTESNILTTENAALRESVEKLKGELYDSNKLIANKLDAIIEVQSIVYSTIRDDSVRQTVNTILNNARYKDSNFKEQLESEITELKSEFENKMASISKDMSDAIDKVSNSVNAAEKAKARSKEINNIEETPRY